MPGYELVSNMMLSCREVTRLVSQRQDRALDFGERFALRAHFALCKGCRNIGRQIDFLRRAVVSLGEHGETAER